jgi:hypothetical protein
MARQSRFGPVGQVQVWLVAVWPGRHGKLRQVIARRGRSGEFGRGKAWPGWAGKVWRYMSRLGGLGCGRQG